MEITYITEIQSFKWLAVVPALAAVVIGILWFLQVKLRKQAGKQAAYNGLMAVIFILITALAVVFSFQKLTTTITNRAVTMDFGIFAAKKAIPLTDIKSIAVRKYDGMKEFSGWGVKGNDQERSYTVSGDEGIEITLKSGGKKLLIGTQQPDKMRDIISKLLSEP